MSRALEEGRRALADAVRPVSLSGAGLSAESGIATFRNPRTGLWTRFDPQVLASPEGFAADPDTVIGWYDERRRQLSQTEPNAAHQALAVKTDMVHITQNVDDLLERAGATNVVRLHGSLLADRCHGGCGFAADVDLANPPGRWTCPHCGAAMRPGVVWFGEVLPPEAWATAEQTAHEADVLLVVGTSAVVYPAAALIPLARSRGARVIVVNTEPTDASDLADVELIGRAGEIVPRLLG